MLEKILESYSKVITDNRILIALLQEFEGSIVLNKKTNKEWKIDLILYRGRNRYELVLRRPVRKFRDIFHFANHIYLVDFLTQYMDGDWELLRKQH